MAEELMILPSDENEAVEGDDDTLSQSSFFYLYDGEELELTPADQSQLLNDMVGKFKVCERIKDDKVEIWDEVDRALNGILSDNEEERFYMNVPFARQTLNTLRAHVWSRSLQTSEGFFAVSGQDEPSKEMSALHKHQLSRHVEKDRLRQKLDRAMGLHGIPKGVLITHTGYKMKTQELYGLHNQVNKWGTPILPPEMQEDVNPNAQAQMQPAQPPAYSTVNKKVFDGGTTKIIDPRDFVFDTENHEDWDACFKGYRTFWTYEDIAQDPNFQNYEDLQAQLQQRKEDESKKKRHGYTRNIEDNFVTDSLGRIELIEIHGDIRLPNGKLLRNWWVVIAGRRNVIRFEKNPFFINPFTKWEYEQTEDGWGVGPCAFILGLVDASSSLFSDGVNASRLNTNPVHWAPQGMVKQKRSVLIGGEILEFKVDPHLPMQRPQQVRFDYQAPFPFVQYCEGQSEATTGATRQLSGNVTTNDKVQTATEFQGLQVVGNMIVDRVVDLFNVDCKIPLIEKTAIINAMFNPESGSVKIIDTDGLVEYKELTEEVYFGNYDYEIEDKKSELERHRNAKEKIAFFKEIVADPEIRQRTNVIDLVKEICRDLGFGETYKYFFDDEELIDKLATDAAIADLVQVQRKLMQMELMARKGITPDVTAIPPTGTPGTGQPVEAIGSPNSNGAGSPEMVAAATGGNI